MIDPLRSADQQHAEALARLAHTVGYAQSGLNASILVNGGALIALFSLIASDRHVAAALWPSGLAFAMALFLTLIAWLCATASQDRFQITSTIRAWRLEDIAAAQEPRYDEMPHFRLGHKLMIAAYAAIILSFAAFITGALLALRALAA